MRLLHQAWTVLKMPGSWGDICISLFVAARLEWLIRRRDLRAASRWAGVTMALDGSSAPPIADVKDVEFNARERARLDVAWRVLRTPPFDATCLRRALVGGYFLRHRDPILRVGVTKKDGQVFAHAWIEIDGVSLDPDGATKYAVLSDPRGGHDGQR